MWNSRKPCRDVDFHQNRRPAMTVTDEASDENSREKKGGRKHLLLTLLRWSIAVIGIGYVVAKTPLYDSVLILGANNRPVKVRLAEEPPTEDFSVAKIVDPQSGSVRTVSR